ncbi:MAG: class I SAM-dependent methyltransferase [Actinomycetota bacterium]
MRERLLGDPRRLREFLLSLDFFDRYLGHPEEGVLYVETHLRRFQRTMALLPPLPSGSRVLELGALPYYFTVLLERELGCEVVPLSFFEVPDAHCPLHIVESRAFGERYEFEFGNLNVEREPFPWAPESFDLVLCCEILEHLLIDPSHVLYESHRVLKPGGTLFLSTPNAVRWENILHLARGRNIYDAYHGNGIYGRHNREYTAGEIRELFEANGFAVDRLTLEDVYDAPTGRRWLTRWLPGRRDTIFARAGPRSPRRRGYPARLYAFMEEYQNVRDDHLVMGVNEVGQIGRGWYHLEPGPPPLRWTRQEAVCHLRRSPKSGHVLCVRLTSHHPDPERHPLRVAVSVNGQTTGRIELRDHAWHTATLPLPAETESEHLQIVLRTDRTWNPHLARGTGDRRDLGVAVERVWLDRPES